MVGERVWLRGLLELEIVISHSPLDSYPEFTSGIKPRLVAHIIALSNWLEVRTVFGILAYKISRSVRSAHTKRALVNVERGPDAVPSSVSIILTIRPQWSAGHRVQNHAANTNWKLSERHRQVALQHSSVEMPLLVGWGTKMKCSSDIGRPANVVSPALDNC